MAKTVETPPLSEEDRYRVMGRGYTLDKITEEVSSVVLTRGTPVWWMVGAFICFLGLNMFIVSATWLFMWGIGIFGNNQPVSWAFPIVNFVWWIGIGHAGTLISAILLLMRQDWRTSINRFAEAMTLFAVVQAGMYPILHLGRPWYGWWLLPYPSEMQLWPQFRSPLLWDVFAISTYASVSLLFWYVGLVPDLGTLRDRTKNRFTRVLFGIFALGWRGSARHWARYERAYLLLAAMSTPLVLSVHTNVSFDFAVSIVPGWHVTVFPPYFVAGAIFAGFAMVLNLAIPVRYAFNLYGLITDRHMENMGKLMLASGLVVAYGYFSEAVFSFYSGNKYELGMITSRMFGPIGWSYWALILCNIAIPQLLWIRTFRTNSISLFIISLFVGAGMWLERFVIFIGSLAYADYLPSSHHIYWPTFWDWSLYIGTIGFFVLLMLLFIRLLPAISMSEMRHLLVHTSHHNGHDGHGAHAQHGDHPVHDDHHGKPGGVA